MSRRVCLIVRGIAAGELPDKAHELVRVIRRCAGTEHRPCATQRWTSGWSRRLSKVGAESYQLGNRYGHMAFVVEDLRAEHSRLASLGLAPTPVKELGHKGQPLARFFFVQDPNEDKTEVLQRQYH